MRQIWIIFLAIATLGMLILIRLRSDRIIRQIWRSLNSPATNLAFNLAMIADLEEPVQRYFLHAIAPETVLATSVELSMSGSFQLKPTTAWLPMQASEIISVAPGFVWQANIGEKLARFRGADYFYRGQGRTCFSFWGLLPFMDAQNKQITRSSIGRLVAAYIWLPSALLPHNQVTWQAIANNTIQASLHIARESTTLTLTIDSDGKLRKISLPRWSNQTEDGSWQYLLFEAEVISEETFGGYTIPSVVKAGWCLEQNNHWSFFRSIIENAKFG
ncbi:hypothetical protein Xen7305DRAFT_00001830 [Xenococcus sp. PCC 7305]|uniref:DUF6920 family protein n=1 Tax=Xenococcus sp. PCC 7305 TaxID=102125 RepID=UPI0002AC7370|nr:DUF6544 family protein [Xenococcus sp. PCC 7305]ELS00482.1 hypothetical protein Xen7305DRAFT_00001830 [Xenococcus sp. PCC 7305]